jgi:hypothetical protein
VYADHDPIVVAHARALLADSSQVTAVEADLRYPRSLLTMREVRDTIDLGQPVAVLLIAVLHFIPDDADPHGIVAAITAPLAPGSYVALSHGTADHLDPGTANAAHAAYEGASAPGAPQPRRHRAVPRRPGARPASPPVFYGGAARIPPK